MTVVFPASAGVSGGAGTSSAARVRLAEQSRAPDELLASLRLSRPQTASDGIMIMWSSGGDFSRAEKRQCRPTPHNAALGITKEPLDVLADESEQRRIPWPSWSVNPGADLHTSIRAGGRGTGGCTRGSPSDACSATDECEHRTLGGQPRSTRLQHGPFLWTPTSPAALTPNDEKGHQRHPGGHPMTQPDTVRRLST